jgi:predicted nucleic acid-binding protein
MRVFLDANVLFTAAYSPKGKAALLLETLGPILLTSDYAAEEARRNLHLKKPAALAPFEVSLATIEVVTSAVGENCPIDLPEKDRPIFLTALRAKATHLLTGDRKDFGRHMNRPEHTAGVLIQTVGDFLDAL